MGAGSWGTTFAKVLADNPANQVMLWARRDDIADEINTDNRNGDYLPGIHLPTAWESRTLELSAFPVFFLSQLDLDAERVLLPFPAFRQFAAHGIRRQPGISDEGVLAAGLDALAEVSGEELLVD